MADRLDIQGDELNAAVTAISKARQDFDNAASTSNDVADSVGHKRLGAALRDFSGTWSLRREKLSTQLGTLERQLRGVIDEFTATDTDLGGQLTPSGGASMPAGSGTDGTAGGAAPEPITGPSSSGVPGPSAVSDVRSDPAAHPGPLSGDPGTGAPGAAGPSPTDPDMQAAAADIVANQSEPVFASYLSWLMSTFSQVGTAGLAAAGVGGLGFAVLMKLGLIQLPGTESGAHATPLSGSGDGGTKVTVPPSGGIGTSGATGTPDGTQASEGTESSVGTRPGGDAPPPAGAGSVAPAQSRHPLAPLLDPPAAVSKLAAAGAATAGVGGLPGAAVVPGATSGAGLSLPSLPSGAGIPDAAVPVHLPPLPSGAQVPVQDDEVALPPLPSGSSAEASATSALPDLPPLPSDQPVSTAHHSATALPMGAAMGAISLGSGGSGGSSAPLPAAPAGSKELADPERDPADRDRDSADPESVRKGVQG